MEQDIFHYFTLSCNSLENPEKAILLEKLYVHTICKIIKGPKVSLEELCMVAGQLYFTTFHTSECKNRKRSAGRVGEKSLIRERTTQHQAFINCAVIFYLFIYDIYCSLDEQFSGLPVIFDKKNHGGTHQS